MSTEEDNSWRTQEVPTYTQAEDSWILVIRDNDNCRRVASRFLLSY